MFFFSVCCDNDFGENVWWLTSVGSDVCHASEWCFWKLLSVSELFQVKHTLLHCYVFYSTTKGERLAKYKYKLTTHCPLEKRGMNLEKLFPLNSVLWKCVIFKKKANVTSKQPEDKQFYNFEVTLTLRVSLIKHLWLFIPVCLLVSWEGFLNPSTGETGALSWMSVEWCELGNLPEFSCHEIRSKIFAVERHKAFYAVEITALCHRLLRSVWV